MFYYGSREIEDIIVQDEVGNSHYISIVMDEHETVFSVTCSYNLEWSWKFWYSKTVYETIKFLIMDCIAENETIEDLFNAMDEVFEEDCTDILIDDDGCDSDCENCGLCEY